VIPSAFRLLKKFFIFEVPPKDDGAPTAINPLSLISFISTWVTGMTAASPPVRAIPLATPIAIF